MNLQTLLIEDNNCLELTDPSGTSKASIYLNDGGSLQNLVLNNCTVIKSLHPKPYRDSYASAILFPFANRIKDGVYIFNNKTYQLHCNDKDNSNAMHGFVALKAFKLIDSELTQHAISATLVYNETQREQGFPFLYSIVLKYTLTQDSLSLKVTIVNNDKDAFPYTIGWHPYFNSSNLEKSTLTFDSTQKFIFDDRMITSKVKEHKESMPFTIKDKFLDDCYTLKTNTVLFNTPDFELALQSTSQNKFFQIYTPPIANTIALEPCTGVSDSFNNGIGLQVLAPNEQSDDIWSLTIHDTN